MFERFTTEAREAVVAAQSVARELGADAIGDEHLLLAVLEGDGIAATVLRGAGADPDAVRRQVAGARTGVNDDADALKTLGIDLAEVRRRAEETFGAGALERESPRRTGFLRRRGISQHIPFTAAAKQAIEQSLRAAMELRHNYIGSEHLLLALLVSPESAAVRALRAIGVTLDRAAARDAIYEELRRSA